MLWNISEKLYYCIDGGFDHFKAKEVQYIQYFALNLSLALTIMFYDPLYT